ncbi:lysine--tRNA ligase [Patescibacteria group bacterium]|nr:lysine--tRNA ligase [Patescibacteria group bacterium]
MNDEALVRKEKLQSFRDAGVDAYPAKSERTAMISVAHEAFDVWAEEQKTVTLCGRVMTTRVHGGLLFADLRDASGKLQILLKLDDIGAELFETFRDRIDPADFVQVTGILFTTQRGEKTLAVSAWKVLTKALLPLPDKFHGLSDQEIRYRYRELDLVSNPESLERFRKRSQIVREFRAALDAEGFDEVETPMLQPIAGGATARPFVTHHNALDLDLYLRIAPELYLKRLVVGGFEKVYEIGRQFRNEGIDWSHNPEFTSIEFYWAYQNYEGLMDFTERLLTRVLRAVNNDLVVIRFREQDIDFSPSWPRVRFADAIKAACGIDIVGMPQDQLIVKMKELNIDTGDKTWNLGKLYDELYKEVVRKKQMQPMFITDYPIEMEPLAKKCDYDPRFVQRFQLIAGGLELLKAYSELNDPIDQLARFNLQQEMREAGDDEAQSIDMTFVRSLEHGMPPTAGWGMGIDRFT